MLGGGGGPQIWFNCWDLMPPEDVVKNDEKTLTGLLRFVRSKNFELRGALLDASPATVYASQSGHIIQV